MFKQTLITIANPVGKKDDLKEYKGSPCRIVCKSLSQLIIQDEAD